MKLFCKLTPGKVDSVAEVAWVLVKPWVDVTDPTGMVFTKLSDLTEVTVTYERQVAPTAMSAPVMVTLLSPGTAVTTALVHVELTDGVL